MTNQEYNSHLLNVYANLFNQEDSNKSIADIEKVALERLRTYATSFNQNFAQELLLKNAEEYTTLEQKLINYPVVFWKTNEGKEVLREQSNLKITQTLEDIFSLADNGKNYSVLSRSRPTVEQYKEMLQNFIDTTKKITLKDQDVGYEMAVKFMGEFEKNHDQMNINGNTNLQIAYSDIGLSLFHGLKNEEKFNQIYSVFYIVPSVSLNEPAKDVNEQVKEVNSKLRASLTFSTPNLNKPN